MSLFFKNYSPFLRNNKLIIKQLIPSYTINELINDLHHYVEYQKPCVQINFDAKRIPTTESIKKILFVLVVAETARAENASQARARS